ncbi:MAG: 4Fe-4S dicluster domain-containing protein [Verrucomicrobia bacterium]|nr:4Fe-4S dicluster domain-containing protein [Verrucomicrobiota bacterium]
MRTVKLSQQDLIQWVTGLIRAQTVIGVQAKDDRFEFAPLSQASDLRLDYDVTVLPPKMFFQPAREPLLAFDGAAGFETLLSDKPFVLLGVHPYDLVAILQMDALFAADNDDIHYRARRKQAVIVACDVQTASPNGFAGCMDTATVSQGFDILITRVADVYLAEAGTAAGAALLADIKKAPEADAASLARREQVWLENRKLLRKHELRVALKDLPALLERSSDHAVWEEKAGRCFSCGSCNLVCPTCYCFDVQDEIGWDLKRGVRCRTWDGCLLKDFATVAGAHNFRKSRADRYRHRYYRKGKYMPDKIGQVACVGCGRCISACVSKIANPVEVYNRLQEES